MEVFGGQALTEEDPRGDGGVNLVGTSISTVRANCNGNYAIADELKKSPFVLICRSLSSRN